MITLITGGIKSGKSRQALQLAAEWAGTEKYFIATAEALDGEMRLRIVKHQAERGTEWRTLEEPLALGAALRALPKNSGGAVVDCLTLWVNNLLYRFENDPHQKENHIQDFFSSLKEAPVPVVLVTNEVGLGIIPDNALSRRYQEELGRVNRLAAEAADEVMMMVSGLPLFLKGGLRARLDS